MCLKIVIIQGDELPVLWISPMIGYLGDTVSTSLLTILVFVCCEQLFKDCQIIQRILQEWDDLESEM